MTGLVADQEIHVLSKISDGFIFYSFRDYGISSFLVSSSCSIAGVYCHFLV